MGKRTFKIILIKPSHYDDDGYVIQWRLSTIPREQPRQRLRALDQLH